MTQFTYYGDLLGIGNYYKLSPIVAQLKLHEFYNDTFNTIRDYVEQNEGNTVELFSDSLFIVGTNAFEGLSVIGSLYVNLLKKIFSLEEPWSAEN